MCIVSEGAKTERRRRLSVRSGRFPARLLPGAIRGATGGRVARALATDDATGGRREDLASTSGTHDAAYPIKNTLNVELCTDLRRAGKA